MPAEEVRPETPDVVRFDYIKSNQFRTIHVDGAWGGITPKLDIYMGLFTMRPAIPTQVAHHLIETGVLGDEIREERKGRGTVIREMEVGVVMDVVTAHSLMQWIAEKLEKIQGVMKEKVNASDNA